MVWASRDPFKHLSLVWLEFVRGIAREVYLIARGYDAASYIAFIVVHAIIIVTGVMFARQASAKTSDLVKA